MAPGMPTVAVINSSEDTVEMLRALLQGEGWEKAALERFVGPTAALEIFTKPYDVDILIETISRTLKAA